jgi:hypothetical protein
MYKLQNITLKYCNLFGDVNGCSGGAAGERHTYCRRGFVFLDWSADMGVVVRGYIWFKVVLGTKGGGSNSAFFHARMVVSVGATKVGVGGGFGNRFNVVWAALVCRAFRVLSCCSFGVVLGQQCWSWRSVSSYILSRCSRAGCVHTLVVVIISLLGVR